MSGFYEIGEAKERPGIYHRIVNDTVPDETDVNGIAAAVVKSNWGPLNEAVSIDVNDDLASILGSGSGYDVVKELFKGGARTVFACRVGTGGTAGSVSLKDTQSTPANAVTVTAKYPGARALTVSLKASLVDSSKKQLSVFEGTSLLEVKEFTAGGDEAASLVAAVADSIYVTAEKVASGTTVTLADVTQAALASGADPTVSTSSYSDGFNAVESLISTNLCTVVVDSDDSAVLALLDAFVSRIYEEGAYPFAVIAGKSTTSFDNRVAAGSAYDSENVIYVINGWKDADGTTYEGYLAAARIAGMVAAIPSNDSLTRKVITDAAGLSEAITGTQIKKALKNGCLPISVSPSKEVRVEKAITTFLTTSKQKDEGWGKIRRAKTRFEMMYRIDTAADALVGTINNDNNGRAAIIAAGQAELDAMVGEGKILSGATMALDPSNPPVGDSAWFVVQADDIDSFETGYLTYHFRFAPESE